MQLAEQINKKWAPVLDHPELPEIKDSHRRAVTALCLENVEKQFAQDQQGGGLLSEATPLTAMGLSTPDPNVGGALGNPTHTDVAFADPVLISMVRRAMPFVVYNQCLDLLDLFLHYVLVQLLLMQHRTEKKNFTMNH